ncbi:type II toxin-antitoxin system RelE family toxin [Nostoc sp. KVJ3]|nr:hypothetical protein [Nostoc sp. KVJ3]
MIYSIEDDSRVVEIIMVCHRSQAYR